MQAVILAGGRGTALRPLNANIPKPLVPLFDRPVIEHTISLLRRHDVHEIIIALSDEAMDIADYLGDGAALGVKLRYSVETQPLGTGGALKQVQGMLHGRFIVVPGDVVSDIDLRAAIEAHLDSPAMATILVSHADDPTQFGNLEFGSDRRVTRYLEKPWSDAVISDTVSTGIYVLEPEALSSIPYFEPSDFASSVLPRMMNNGDPVYAAAVPGYWCDIGNISHYRNVHFDALEGKLQLDLPATQIVDGVWIGARAQIHSAADVAAPVYVGDGAVIRPGAAIGSHCVIGSEAIIDEGAVVERSVIGDHSVIGKNTRITESIIGSGYTFGENELIADATLVEDVTYERVSTRVVTEPQPAPALELRHDRSKARAA